MTEEVQEIPQEVQEIPEEMVMMKQKAKKRVMTESQKESLRLAREKATQYRLQLKEEKEKMGIKDEKKLNKTQLKLLKLKEQREQKEMKEEEEEVEEVKEEVKVKVKVKEEVKEETKVEVVEKVEKVVKKVVGKVVEKVEVVEKAVYADDNKVVVKTRPSFIRNENGFFCI
jgi:hypothetical protein